MHAAVELEIYIIFLPFFFVDSSLCTSKSMLVLNP